MIGTGEEIVKMEREEWYAKAIDVRKHTTSNKGGGVGGEMSAIDRGMAGNEKESPAKGGFGIGDFV